MLRAVRINGGWVARSLCLSFFCTILVAASDQEKTTVDLNVLLQVLDARKQALLCNAVTPQDSTPAIAKKAEAYITVLEDQISRLRTTYYSTREPTVFNGAIVRKWAEYLASLHYPISSTLGASYYSTLIQSYYIRILEEEILLMAREIFKRIKAPDISVIGTETDKGFSEWQLEWMKIDNILDVTQRPFQKLDWPLK